MARSRRVRRGTGGAGVGGAAICAALGVVAVGLSVPAATGALAEVDPHTPLLHRTGPPPGHTGGFGEPTCRICHEGDDLNAFDGSVRLLGLPGRWEPAATYVLTVVLEAPETEAAGFQLSSRFAEGPRRAQPAGRLAPLSPRVAVTPGPMGQPYAHHTAEGTLPPDDAGSSWLVEWTAPEGAGPVVFHVAANSANGDNSPLLDLVYVAEVTVPGGDPRR